MITAEYRRIARAKPAKPEGYRPRQADPGPPGQRLQTVTRRDTERRMNRFYTVTVHPDLLVGWTVQREWGRIGSSGRVAVQPFAGRTEAEQAAARIEAAKRRRVYR
jgi:predicted DNA-binding WGR domain protein